MALKIIWCVSAIILGLVVFLADCEDSSKACDKSACRAFAKPWRLTGSMEAYMESMQDILRNWRTKLQDLHEEFDREGSDQCDNFQKKDSAAKPGDCSEAYHYDKSSTSGIYRIYPRFLRQPVDVYCDMETDGGGWTVFQRRNDYEENNQTDFFRDWNDYKTGFGNLDKEFWLGNDAIFALTSSKPMTLRIDLEDFEGNKTYAKYDDFTIRSEIENYVIILGNYDGNAGDSMRGHANNSAFSARDRDNDKYNKHCSQLYKGGWWYGACHEANLNGLNLKGHHDTYADGINWYKFRGAHYSLKFTEMKMRPKTFGTSEEPS